MKRITLKMFAFILAIFTSQNIIAQEVLFEEHFDNGLGEFKVDGNNGENNNIWAWNDYLQTAVADAYGKIGTSEYIENYLYTPDINLLSENTITFDQDYAYFEKPEEMVGIYIRESGYLEWTKIEFTLPEATGKLTNAGEIALPKEFENKTVQIGFRYSSVGSGSSGVWEFDNIIVKGIKAEKPEGGSVLFTETFDEDLGKFVVEGNNGKYNDIWTWNYYLQTAVADAYTKIGADEYVENYLVSPEITLQSNNTVTFDQDNSYFTDKDNMIGLYIREAGTSEWTKIEIQYTSDKYMLVNVGDIAIPTEFDNKTVQFGFKYVSNGSESSGVWEFDNFIVKCAEGGTTGINEIKAQNNDNKIYDLQGRRVNNAVKGIYIVNGKKIIIR